MKKMILILLVIVPAFVSAPVSAYAEGTTGDYFRDIGIKFARGLGNTLGSLAELPCTISTETQDRGAVGVAAGFGIGLARMLRRLLNGVTEVGTFIIPMEATLPPVCKGEGAMIRSS